MLHQVVTRSFLLWAPGKVNYEVGVYRSDERVLGIVRPRYLAVAGAVHVQDHADVLSSW